MSAYIEIIIPEADASRRDLLIVELEQLGFEGFEEETSELKAYIPQEHLDEEGFARFSQTYLTKSELKGMERHVLPDQNWNRQWESAFDPVIIGDFCAIRADFHDPVPGTKHEIVITPKMSFGTGHHATTRLMISRMRELPMRGKHIVDFGTGTGVLAILAERLGAETVRAVDHDSWSIDNSRENLSRNGAEKVTLHLADTLSGLSPADGVLANINRQVLLSEMPALSAMVVDGGWLLLSGILEDDRPLLVEAATAHGFRLDGQSQEGAWIAQLWIKEKQK